MGENWEASTKKLCFLNLGAFVRTLLAINHLQFCDRPTRTRFPWFFFVPRANIELVSKQHVALHAATANIELVSKPHASLHAATANIELVSKPHVALHAATASIELVSKTRCTACCYCKYWVGIQNTRCTAWSYCKYWVGIQNTRCTASCCCKYSQNQLQIFLQKAVLQKWSKLLKLLLKLGTNAQHSSSAAYCQQSTSSTLAFSFPDFVSSLPFSEGGVGTARKPFNTLRTGSFKLFKRTSQGFLTVLTL